MILFAFCLFVLFSHAFCLFMQPAFRDKQVSWTKTHAEECNAGGPGSLDWQGDITRQEIDNNIATELINGIHPYPSLRHYFNQDGVVFNDTTVMELWGNKKTGYRRVEQVRRFLRYEDPAVRARRKRDDIFADTRAMTDSLCHQCESTFDIGENTSLDEVDISTQTSFKGKETIKYKAAGDGILKDAVADSTCGALFTFLFRKDSAIQMRERDPEIFDAAPELSPLHFRCLILYRRPCLRGKWRTAWMDNLFPSLRFAYYMHKLAGTHITGLVRGKRGFPKVAWQAVIKSERLQQAAKGTVKTASLLDGTFGLFALSVYDNKPVHVFSTNRYDEGYVELSRKWHENGVMSVRRYKRLVVIHLYNALMGGESLIVRNCMHASYINHMLCMNACMQVSICLTGSIGSTCLVASMSGMHKNGHCPCTGIA